ncbi:type B 50S ribosomal protein L31 [Rheinheimera riviphila]|uniref:Large ribosomal subunit protein bL31B n=1 Tax=Rheinheimera riviphila TaxID=1834037 RepID=A0A437QBY0_9GAMM|nr:type B 50S ribosomal protein L31 [Rheinheimera riviphila]RVU32060.1 type B 50S ribosomal protein L31 [Rheinheimera riviphila]
MKKNIHPAYRTVLFHDLSVDAFFLVGSTIDTSRTYQWTDGETYPYIALDVSSASHPFYTGRQKVTQTEGRVAAFSKKFGALAKSSRG